MAAADDVGIAMLSVQSSTSENTNKRREIELEELIDGEGEPLVPQGHTPARPTRVGVVNDVVCRQNRDETVGNRLKEETATAGEMQEFERMQTGRAGAQSTRRHLVVSCVESEQMKHPDYPSDVPTPVASHGLPRQINMNHYATKKTIATGLLVVSVLMANAALLKSVLQQGKQYEFYGFLVSMLVLAILTEIATGVLLLLIGRDDLNNIYKQKKLDWLNNVATACVLGITVINIFIAAFGLKNTPVRDAEM
ncbi:uncharacterized protein [Ptychodera flava]|uniref:uncharacterized protein n=1 Tax=Ptychodera flava TaxID=63121 RepID=UPI00396A03B1